MIKTITVTNHLSESVVIDLRSPEQSGFFIRGIDGLGPPKAVINTTESLGLDGSVYNSARASQRNIVLNMGFVDFPTIEDARQRSYQFFPIKRRVDILVETDNRIASTYGYVESNEPDIFSRMETAVISILCPSAYLTAPEVVIVEFSNVINNFEFPFSNESLTENLIVFSDLVSETEKVIHYEGDAPTGITMHIHFLGLVTNLSIFNEETRESLTIDNDIIVSITGEDIQAGDEIVIVTVRGQKSVTLWRDGVATNVLNAIVGDSPWFSLEKGDNTFLYDADFGVSNVQFTVEYHNVYEGI